MTSIEWLLEQVEHNISKTIIEQAKEMHKAEIIDAFKSGDCNGTFETINAEKYYNQQFKKD